MIMAIVAIADIMHKGIVYIIYNIHKHDESRLFIPND